MTRNIVDTNMQKKKERRVVTNESIDVVQVQISDASFC